MDDLTSRARHWIASDPDPETRAQLQALLDSGDLRGLEAAMGPPLEFGTAGIRGEVGPGPGRINRATVIRTTRGLAEYLLQVHHGPPTTPVALGFDARPSSPGFAAAAAGVLAAAGIRVSYFPEATPTPLVAFAAKVLSSPAAVVITASHNPPGDNGYKVYGPDAAQIVPPVDVAIASAIAGVGAAADVPIIPDPFSGRASLVEPVPGDLFDRYRIEIDSARPNPQSSHLKVVYTPIHGVGGEVVARLCAAAEHTGLIPVPEQFQPDGRFPTVRFPNPEEPGALDLAIALASELDAALVLANDPDADRLAVVVRSVGGWRPLSGNELGVLLGDYVLGHWRHEATPVVASSVVSTPMMRDLAAARGARHEITLTGFKWIIRAGLALEERGEGRFAFGFEEALGYSVGRVVRDKDGISAAIVTLDLVAEEERRGRGLLGRLIALWEEFGLWVSAQHSLVATAGQGPGGLATAVDLLAESPPPQVGGLEVTAVVDYRSGEEHRPPWLGAQDLVELELGAEGRVLVRPSGTEPKLKVYVDLRGSTGRDPVQSHRALTSKARELAEETGRGLTI